MIINKELFKWQNILVVLAVAIVVHYLFGRWTQGSQSMAATDTPPTAGA